MKNTILFGLITFLISILACQNPSCQEKLKKNKLIPFSVKYIEGDDGLQTYILEITQKDTTFSAKEIMTDNYSYPYYFDTSYIDKLNNTQILAAREFLITIPTLPNSCGQPTSLTQELTLNTLGDEFRIHGNCLWGSGSYMNLRKALFNK